MRGPTSFMQLLMMLKKRLIAAGNHFPSGLCQVAEETLKVDFTLCYQAACSVVLYLIIYGVY